MVSRLFEKVPRYFEKVSRYYEMVYEVAVVSIYGKNL